MSWYIGALIGMGAATVRVVLGLLQAGERFEWRKAGRTLAIGLITGGLTGGLWANGSPRAVFVAVFAETVALDQIITTIQKNQ